MEAKGRLWRKSHMPLIPYFLGEGGGQGGEVENKRPVWGGADGKPSLHQASLDISFQFEKGGGD